MSRKERRRQQKLGRKGQGTPPDRSAGERLLAMAAQALASGNLPEAQSLCRRALDNDPENPEVHHLLAVLALRSGNGAIALKHLKTAIRAAPDRPDIQNNLGNALTSLGRIEEAATAFARAADLAPGMAEAHYNLGQALRRLGRHEEAEPAFRRSLQLAPDDAVALNGLGIVLKAMGRPDEAEAAFRGAVDSRPGHIGAWLNLANLLILMGRETDAIAAYERVLAIEPENTQALANIYRPLQSACAWDRLAELDGPLDRATDRALAAGLASIEEPFLNVSRCADPARNLAVGRSWAEAMVRGAEGDGRRKRPRKNRHGLLTIGYLSNDFRDHPVAHLVARTLELHSHGDFRIVGISGGIDDGSACRRRIVEACDGFVDIRGVSDAEAARRIAGQEIDILIDLGGHTRGTRLSVCARRPAPVQVSWLGYPGTTGADFIDYLFADRTVVPPEHKSFFSEKIVYLPGSYLPCGDKPEIAGASIGRTSQGLPPDAFVFCSFNQSFKIEPGLFDAWLAILTGTPDSVLWLPQSTNAAEENLRRTAAERGVDPGRMIFAGRIGGRDEHLARLALADLALDTWTFGGHTTTVDALVAGVPVISRAGGHFASRACASVLRSAGLGELVVESAGDYEALAVRLARDPESLSGLRQKLGHNREAAPFFERDAFVRHLEDACRRMWERHAAGEKSISFSVS